MILVVALIAAVVNVLVIVIFICVIFLIKCRAFKEVECCKLIRDEFDAVCEFIFQPKVLFTITAFTILLNVG